MGTPDKIDPCVLIIKYWLFVLARGERSVRRLFSFMGIKMILTGSIGTTMALG
jgi:hypothetical protein